MNHNPLTLFDAGVFIGALLRGDQRHHEARPVVEAARKGALRDCTTVGILSEVYAALTWIGAQPPHAPEEAAHAVRLLIEAPSAIQILTDGSEVCLKMLALVKTYDLTTRRVHGARHAATALCAGVTQVYTYDIADWTTFQAEGISVISPASLMTGVQTTEERP